MNIPFPVLFPRIIDPSWFFADSPCDEDAELSQLEQEYELALNSVRQNKEPKPATVEEETYNNEDEVENEASGEERLEELSTDEEEMHLHYSSSPPDRNNDDIITDSLEDITETIDSDTPDQSSV